MNPHLIQFFVILAAVLTAEIVVRLWDWYNRQGET